MKFLLSLLLSIALNTMIFAQDHIINEIKNEYYSVTEDNDNYNYHDLSMNFILAAVGEKTKTIRYYHESVQADPERDPYDMNFSLKKVEVKYNVSASNFYTNEYLYNNEGQLIFYFNKAEGSYENHEKRYYYHNNKLIKCIIKETDEIGNSDSFVMTKEFSEEVLSDSGTETEKAQKHLLFFKQFKLIDNID